MKTYHGERIDGVCYVTVDGRELDPRFDLANLSPTGFEWGYCGSGPAQLALLADCLGNDGFAAEFHQEFKRQVVSLLPRDAWTLTEDDVRRALPAQGG